MVEESAAWVQEAVQSLAAVGAVPVVVGLAPAADLVPALFAVVAVAPAPAGLRAIRTGLLPLSNVTTRHSWSRLL